MNTPVTNSADCFPGATDADSLPAQFSLARLQQRINREHENALRILEGIISPVKKPATYMKNRIKVDGFYGEVEKIIAQPLATVGSVRRARADIDAQILQLETRDASSFSVEASVTHAIRGAFTQVCREYGKTLNGKKADPPSWMAEFKSADKETLVNILRSSAGRQLNREELEKFVRTTNTSYAKSPTSTDALVKKILHSFGNTNSVLHAWLNNYVSSDSAEEQEEDDYDDSFSFDLSRFVRGADGSVQEMDRQDAHASTVDTLGAEEKKPRKNGYHRSRNGHAPSAASARRTVKAAPVPEEKPEDVAAQLLARLADNQKLLKAERQRCSPAVSRLVLAGIRRSLEEQIQEGNSVFGPDEIEVAFRVQLKEYKLEDMLE